MGAANVIISIVISLSVVLNAFSLNKRSERDQFDGSSDVLVDEGVVYNEDKCPNKIKRKKDRHGRVRVKGDDFTNSFEAFNSALIEKREHTISFDVIYLEEYFSNEPLRLFFDNNQVELSRKANEDFLEYVEKTKNVLAKMGDDKGLVLYIKGFASQVPTSFSSGKKFDNLNKDRSSVLGSTSRQNNLGLAHSRVLFIMNKIKDCLPGIEIVMNEKEDVRIGDIEWTNDHQKRLRIATINNDSLAIDSLFSPFRAEQYVSISSKYSFVRTVQPNDVKMYAITTLPCFVKSSSRGVFPINEALIVSESTYALIGEKLVFNSSEERDSYLKERGLEIVVSVFRGEERWFMISNDEEKQALKIKDEEEKIEVLFKLGIVHYQDKMALEKILTRDSISKNRYTYRVLHE